MGRLEIQNSKSLLELIDQQHYPLKTSNPSSSLVSRKAVCKRSESSSIKCCHPGKEIFTSSDMFILFGFSSHYDYLEIDQ